MNILGINAYHGDSSACLVKDGRLIAAVEEERFKRIKHWAGFPSEAIRFCLKDGNIPLEEVDHVAVNRDPNANRWRKIRFAIANRPDMRVIIDRVRNAKKWTSIEEELARTFVGERFQGKLHYVEHHLAHLASAFLVSPFENATVVSLDGFGDFASAAWGVGRQSDIRIDGKIYFPHSLGIFYTAMTQYLGFPHYGDEYKVMGLAPYGKPRFIDSMRKIILLCDNGTFSLNLEFFRHHRENINYTWNNCVPRRFEQSAC